MWNRAIENQRKADLGNGSFLNPILIGDHSDPAILKDCDDYYTTFSSFNSYTEIVIWHSRDLVNWNPFGSALKNWNGLGSTRIRVRDLWAKKELGVFDKSFGADLRQHACGLYRISAAD